MNDPSPLPLDPTPAPEASGSPADAAARIARLEAELALRDDVLSLAAHELRNPLHALALHLALARTLAESGSPGVADRLRSAERTLKRYTERVTVLMDLLGSTASTYPLTPRETDVAALLEGVAESLRDEAARRGIELRIAASEACVLRTDSVVLEQVVDNLVLNALKHSGARCVELRCRSEGDACIVSVEDDGHGIAAEDRQAIFEKFAVARHSPRGTGSGLGLWIVTRLMHALGGAIRLADAPSGGCLFEATLPKSAHKETAP